MAGLKRGSADEYEAGISAAAGAGAVWHALELAVRFHLEHDCGDQLSDDRPETRNRRESQRGNRCADVVSAHAEVASRRSYFFGPA